ncbi:putative baseplate assembly protein [Streptomyces zhaozhouensis]|uniref:Putative baseplate assembly protein n=1 Tax=Streptomyces zhaozhouensis TaxID=1300267 RepID=A0A286E8Z0_9ACTN|nr:putative baseplate assembly protein [Streptomyces zhaozhouensis]SOD67372.1 putative baseplate assembly protein [Streptomyces zhaozhouensis]
MTGRPRERGDRGYDPGRTGAHDERRAPAPIHNPPGRSVLDLRVGDHGTLLAAMLDRLASPAYPALRELTVRTPDDPALALLDAWAVLGDTLTFHGERAAQESYLRTAVEHRSIALLGRLVGYRPRPGVAATTHLAYTVEADSRTGPAGTEVLIPRGARSHSVPTGSRGEDERAQTFETDRDLVARAEWNALAVRRRRPALLTEELLRGRSEIFVEGTGHSLAVGERLLFVFGRGAPSLLSVAGVRVDRAEGVTAIRLPEAPPPTPAELVAEVRRWITAPPGGPGQEPGPDHPLPPPLSGLVEDFDARVLAPLRADLDQLTGYQALVTRLADPLERAAEAVALAEPHPEVAAWFTRLAAALAQLARRAAALGPAAPGAPAGAPANALAALGALLPALRGPAAGRRLVPATGRPDPGLAARLLAPRGAGGDRAALHAAWRHAALAVPVEPDTLREIAVMRVRAAPFGATAPQLPVQDGAGRTVRQSDWPLTGGTLTTVRVVHDTAGGTAVRAEFTHADAGGARQHSVNLPADSTTFELGPGSVQLTQRGTEGYPDTVAELRPGLPARTVTVTAPGAGGELAVTVDGAEAGPLTWTLAPGDERQGPHGDYQVTARHVARTEPAAVEIGIATPADPETRNVLRLDAVHDTVAVGSRIVVERPGKGAEDGIPGDAGLARVSTRVTGTRTAAYAEFGITGRGTELTLADPWLDAHDTLLSHIRGAVVHAGAESLPPGGEPLGADVAGDTIELAELYEGLSPGRVLAVSGERTDVPGAEGVTATELAVVGAVEHTVDPRLPGDRVHTVLTLTAELAHTYRRDTVRVQGNVVPASHGESRDEAVGSGDSAVPHQTFALWRSPLTWLPDDSPLGASPTLEIRVDGLLWRRVDSLAGRGPTARVYVLGTDAEGRTTVTFGDGRHGARLPTGEGNVRAAYRFGVGEAGNVPADAVTQALTRPLGVTGVTNPVPATGGADQDGDELAAPGAELPSAGGLPAGRHRVPLAVSTLDRLVSTRDYEDFARSRAGIDRAVATELFDGRRTALHLTVAGAGDGELAEDSEVLRALRVSLAEHGDAHAPVLVDPRERVPLLLAARVRVAPDHAWRLVEPRLRAALYHELGFAGRELGQPVVLSDVLAIAHSVPGVDWVDVERLAGLPPSTTPAELLDLLGRRDEPPAAVPARLAEYREETYRVTDEAGETLTSVAARHRLTLARLLRLNPDITDTSRLPAGRVVHVFRGIRPAQLVLLAPELPDSLILTEVPR